MHGVPFWGRFWCAAPFLGSILVHGVWCADFGADFVARCAFLGSILARCLFGSITASGQQDLSRLERACGEFGARCAFSGRGAPFLGWILVRVVWCADFGADFGARCVVFGLAFGAPDFRADFGARCAFLGSQDWRGPAGESSPRPVEYGALVLAHDALSGGFWCEVRLFGLCGAPFLRWILVISVHGASFLGSVLVRGAPFLVSILADFGADFGARCAFLESFLVCGGSILVHGVWCADFGADFVARCAFLGSILARCLFGIDFGIDFGAWCADVGVDPASGQEDLSKHEHFVFWRFVGHLLVDLKTS